MNRLLISASAWGLLSACQFDADLRVAQRSDGRIEFQVSSRAPGYDACINAISIMHRDGAENAPDWYASNQEAGTCPDTIVYGEAHPGFRTGTGPQPLRPGRDYEVTVYGGGFTVAGKFRITPDGLYFTELY